MTNGCAFTQLGGWHHGTQALKTKLSLVLVLLDLGDNISCKALDKFLGNIVFSW